MEPPNWEPLRQGRMAFELRACSACLGAARAGAVLAPIGEAEKLVHETQQPDKMGGEEVAGGKVVVVVSSFKRDLPSRRPSP